jgi:outer membrane biosynthesis protein TonB
MENRRKAKRASRVSVAISAGFHLILVGVLLFFAAREGLLGKQLKKIAVTMVPKEKTPEKPKEKPPEPKVAVEPVKAEQPKTVQIQAPQIAKAPAAAPPPSGAAPSAAPPPATLGSFDFEGGKVVETTSDPNVLYKGFVEYTLRSHWTRPDGVVDDNFVAEVELAVDPSGRVTGSDWKKGSGNPVWDGSVKKALAETSSIGRPPPKGFPPKVLVRFDVQVAEETIIQ